MRHDDNRKPWISPTQPATLSMPGSYLSRSSEVSLVPDGATLGGTEKGNRNPVIYADEKSIAYTPLAMTTCYFYQ